MNTTPVIPRGHFHVANTKCVGRVVQVARIYTVPILLWNCDKPHCIGTGTAAALRLDYYPGSAAKVIRAQHIPLTGVCLLLDLNGIEQGMPVIYFYRNTGTSARLLRPPQRNLIGPFNSGLKHILDAPVPTVKRVITKGLAPPDTYQPQVDEVRASPLSMITSAGPIV